MPETLDIQKFARDMLTFGKRAAENFARKNEEFIPTFLFLNGEEVSAVPIPYYTHDRDFHIAMLKGLLDAKQADAFCFIMEAWISMPPPGTKYDPKVPPSKDPNRKEGIVIHTAHRDGREVMLMCEIKRHGHKLKFEEPIDMSDDGMGKGMMAIMSNMFGTEKVN